MTRRASQRQNLSISLFPFLAVLICTMGVIIVMLVIVVRQASARAAADIAAAEEASLPAATVPVGPTDADRQQHEQIVQDLSWERDVLAQQRDERVAELARLRQTLAHVEDHLRRLQEQAKQLLTQAQAIDQGKQLSNPELDAAKAELAQKQAEIELAKAEVEKLKQQRAAKDRWYALIPYDGPNGTRRRPVYIECSEAGIVLQPEGLVLMPDDFNGPLGPGNPLDAALKAKREYLERHGERGMPYPLLIVRPDGIVAYMVARAALKAWEEEFGYELIDAEMKLTYGEPDPALAQTMAQSVRQARQRQAVMVASMPGRYQAEDSLQSFNSSDALAQQPEMEMAGRGLGRSSNATGGGVGGDPRSGGVGTGGTGQGGIGSGSGISYATGGPNGSAAGQAGGGGTPNSLRQPGGGQSGNGGTFGSASSSPAGSAANQSANGGSTQANGSSNGSGGSAAGGKGGASGSGSAMAGGSQWSNVAGGGSAGASGSSAAGSSSPNSVSAMSGSASSGSSQSGGKPGQPGQSAGSTSRKGHNWGLLNSNGRTVAVARPIRIRLQPHQIVVLPDVGDAVSPVVIPLREDDLSHAEVEAFVQAVQRQIESWGIAAENGFWRPQLSFDVSSTAEPRYQQWEQALNGSGYELKRKHR